MSDVTHMLSQIQSGDHQASEKQLSLLYDKLPNLAAACLANERADHTLQATALAKSARCSTGNWQSMSQYGLWIGRAFFI